MSKRKTTESSAFISEAEARRVLTILCVKLGFCLPPVWDARLQKNPPRSVEKFVVTVFRAEGLEPKTAGKDIYRSVAKVVREGFERSACSLADP